MAYLQLLSNNPDLSYILMKNPESGISLRGYRQGTFFGWFSQENTCYNLYFKDGDDEISFKKSNEEFEYNDTKRYNSPLVVIGAVNEYFRQFTNGELHVKDLANTYTNTILINQLHIFNVKYIDLLNKYYNGFNITTEELSPYNYRIKITTNKTMRDLVNYSYILAMFYHCLTSFDTWVDENEIERYVRILNNLDSPYFIRYVVKSRIIRSNKKFLVVKKELERCSYQQIELELGDTHLQRSEFISNMVSGKYEVVDIGCNDMRSYGLKIAKILNKSDTLYHAIDIDEEAIIKATKRVGNNALENVIFYPSINDLLELDYVQKFDIIMSEVFEHIQLKEDTKIIKDFINKVNFNQFIITTPNKDFNQYYVFDDEKTSRLEEHVFEMTENEFKGYFNKLLKKFTNITYEFHNIGDKVNGITPTQAIVIKKI